MEALTYLESSISPETGFPVWLTRGMDAAGRFAARSEMDWAAEALDRARAADRDPQPGRRWYVTSAE